MSLPESFDDRLMADLAAAADGTLALERQSQIETLAAHDPELAEALDRQRKAAALIRDAAADVTASESLRARIARLQDER
jgi:anti-sigma-K factor RskA